MTSDQEIVSCHLRSRIAQLEAFAAHADSQAARPPGDHECPELFAELEKEHAQLLRVRVSQLKDELAMVEGQGALQFA